jgi:hypothetical protein
LTSVKERGTLLVKCEAKTCINYREGMCQAEALEIKNFTWYSEEKKEEEDEMICNSYEYFINWMFKR